MNVAKLGVAAAALGVLGYGIYVIYKDNVRPVTRDEEREIEAELEFLRQRIEDLVKAGKCTLSADEAWMLDRLNRQDWKKEHGSLLRAMRKLHDKVYNIKK